MRARIAAWACPLLLLAAGRVTAAQALPAPSATAQDASLQERRAALEAELATLGARLEQAGPEAKAGGALAREVELLGQLQALLLQHESLEEARRAAEQARTAAAEALRAQREGERPVEPPYGFLALDALQRELHEETQRAQKSAAQLAATREALARARSEREEKARALRLARERGEGGDQAARRSNETRLAELELQVAQELQQVRELEAAIRRAEQEQADLRVEAATERIDYAAPRTSLTDGDRSDVALELARQEDDLQQAKDAAQRALDYLTGQWQDARRRLDQSGSPERALVEEVETLKRGQAYRRSELMALTEELHRVTTMRSLWERRFALFTGSAGRGVALEWERESREALRALEVAHELAADHLEEARTELQQLAGRAPAAGAERWLAMRATFLQALVRVHEANLASMAQVRRLHEQLIDEVGAGRGSFDLWGALATVWKALAAIWTYEFAVVEDSPITVGKIVIGILLLVFGVHLSRVLSRLLGSRLLPRLGLSEGGLQAYQSLAFYALVAAFALMALNIVNVPLTAFTILGGALAIGFGFGSQNLVNNFISGLILLVERPIRVADLIQVGDLYGTVEHIGLRSTRVRTGTNVELIVPNSSFLQENVVNWTLTDSLVRVKVAVGVAYGSNPREVRDLLHKAATGHGRVLKSPDPIVLFNNFGDNALEFEVHFWIRMRSQMDQRTVESDLRFMIEGLCREAGVVIAFPQRDVHLDTLRPLEVRMVPGTGEPGETLPATPAADA